MGFFQYKQEQFLPADLDVVWEFIAFPQNLKKITPPHMGFDIMGDPPKEMYPGMIIEYRINPFPIYRTVWVTEITQIREKEFFIDEQRVGPYKLWHHQHTVEKVDGGTLMKDIVSYQPPFGFLGTIANSIIVRRKIESIFAYRTQALEKIFPGK